MGRKLHTDRKINLYNDEFKSNGEIEINLDVNSHQPFQFNHSPEQNSDFVPNNSPLFHNQNVPFQQNSNFVPNNSPLFHNQNVPHSGNYGTIPSSEQFSTFQNPSLNRPFYPDLNQINKDYQQTSQQNYKNQIGAPLCYPGNGVQCQQRPNNNANYLGNFQNQNTPSQYQLLSENNRYNNYQSTHQDQWGNQIKHSNDANNGYFQYNGKDDYQL